MSEWRKSIKITFPIYIYHPPYGAGGGLYNPQRTYGGTLYVKDLIFIDSPTSIWGSHDGTDLHRHGGMGLSRSVVYPSKAAAIPGGILDAKGLHIPILDLDAPQNPPKGLAAFCLGFWSLFRTYKYRYSFGEPEQLSLDEFKERLIKLCYQEKRMPRPIKRIKAAESFYDLMTVETDTDMMEEHYKPVEVKNWIDAPKKYS